MIKYKYLGGGHLPGVPSRDLTVEEAKKYDENSLVACGLYELVESKTPLQGQETKKKGGK